MAIIQSNGTGGGNWSAGATWNGGVAPVIGTDEADIVAGDTVTVDTTGLGCGSDPGAGTDGLTVNGTLNYATGANSDLTVRGGITVASGGTLYDGTQLPFAYQHILKVDCVDTADKYRLNISDGGIFKPYGTTVTTPWASLASNVASAQKVVVTNEDISDWQVGDYVFLPCTTSGSYNQGEINTITSVDTNYQFTATNNWAYTHLKNMETWMPDCACLNLSRNVRLESANTTYPFAVRNKSQAMANFNLKNTELRHMGNADTNRSLVFCNSDSTPVYTLEAFGYVDGSTFHGGTGNYGNPGFYFTTYGSTGNNVTYSDNFFIGTYANQRLATCVVYCSPTSFERCVFAHQVGVQSTYMRALLYLANDVEGWKDCLFAGIYYAMNLGSSGSKLADYDNTGNTLQCCYYGVYRLANFQDISDTKVAGGGYGIYSAGARYEGPNLTDVYLKGSVSDIYSVGLLYFDNCYSYGVFDVGVRPVIGVHFHKLNGEAGNHYSFLPYGNVASAKSTFSSPRNVIKTAGSMSVMIEPVDANNSQPIVQGVAAENAKQIAVTGYIRKTSAYNGGSEPSVSLSGVGMTTDTYVMSGGAGAWELFTVSGTPTEGGISKLTTSCVGTAGYVYIDDIVVTAADANTGDFDNWIDGMPASMLFATKVDAAQLAVSVADAVWDEAKADHVTAGSFGKSIGDIETGQDYLLKIVKNKKELKKAGEVWYLIVYDDDTTTPILSKVMLDKVGMNITDLAAGTLASEMANSV